MNPDVARRGAVRHLGHGFVLIAVAVAMVVARPLHARLQPHPDDVEASQAGPSRSISEVGRTVLSCRHEPIPKKSYSAANPLFMMNPRFVVATEHYDFNGESGGPSHYSYDEDGKLVEKVFERSDGLRTVTTFEYDSNGLLISSHRAYADGRSADFRYSYDETRRLTGKTFRRSDGAEGFEHYAYDALGRLATATYRNMDFWLNGTIDYSYDDRSCIVGGRFSGDDGFDADLAITTDGDGNVVRVHWMFSFGKTQTYTLGYRELVPLPPQ